jgi:hypothetical protein
VKELVRRKNKFYPITCPEGIRSPDQPGRSESLYRPSIRTLVCLKYVQNVVGLGRLKVGVNDAQGMVTEGAYTGL